MIDAFNELSNTDTAVIVAEPKRFAVTVPFSDTEITAELELDHVTFLLITFSGVKLYVNFLDAPNSNSKFPSAISIASTSFVPVANNSLY